METTHPAQERWLEAHPYLEQMARFVGAVERAAAAARPAEVPAPCWADHAGPYQRGVPLLRSDAFTPELLGAAAQALVEATERAAAAPLPPKLGKECQALRETFRRAPEDRLRAVRWLAAGAPDREAPAHAGLLRFLGWTALRHALEPVLRGFADWREERPWRRAHCPTCGARPAMAQLLDGTRRLLSCGCCRTRWTYSRVGCPYCGNDAPDRLGILELEGEPRLRIDLCEGCQGYLKTYVGQGEEEVFLADWPTLHLDVLARERGFERLGASLYESP